MAQAIFSAVVLVGLLSAAQGSPKTVIQFVNGKLPEKIIPLQKAKMMALGTTLNLTPRGARLPQTDWYHPVDYAADQRLQDIGKLVVQSLAKNENGKLIIGHCSAFFIGADLLATAAHCLVDLLDLAAGTGFAFFLQHFDPASDMDPNKMDAIQGRILIATEWWYPADYATETKRLRKYGGAYDYAFVRLDKKKQNEDRYFSLTVPGDLVEKHQVFMVAGFPDDVASQKEKRRVFAPVFVSATLQASNSQGIKDAMIAHQKHLGTASLAAGTRPHHEVLDDVEIKDKQVGAMGDGGNAANGASGGPWLIKSPTKAQQSSAIGIQAWSTVRPEEEEGAPPKTKEQVKVEQAFLRPMFSVRVTKEMEQIQEHLRSNKDGGTFISLA